MREIKLNEVLKVLKGKGTLMEVNAVLGQVESNEGLLGEFQVFYFC